MFSNSKIGWPLVGYNAYPKTASIGQLLFQPLSIWCHWKLCIETAHALGTSHMQKLWKREAKIYHNIISLPCSIAISVQAFKCSAILNVFTEGQPRCLCFSFHKHLSEPKEKAYFSSPLNAQGLGYAVLAFSLVSFYIGQMVWLLNIKPRAKKDRQDTWFFLFLALSYSAGKNLYIFFYFILF